MTDGIVKSYVMIQESLLIRSNSRQLFAERFLDRL